MEDLNLPPVAPPRRPSWPAQYAAGFFFGVLLPPGLFAAVRLGVGETVTFTLYFALIWIAIYLCLRYKSYIALLGGAIGGALSYGLLRFMVVM